MSADDSPWFRKQHGYTLKELGQALRMEEVINEGQRMRRVEREGASSAGPLLRGLAQLFQMGAADAVQDDAGV